MTQKVEWSYCPWAPPTFKEYLANYCTWDFFQTFLVVVNDLATVLSESILQALEFMEF